jgi:hypothetical protein
VPKPIAKLPHAAAAFGAPLEKLTFVDADGDIVTISTLDDLASAAATATGRELLLHGVFAAAVAAGAAAGTTEALDPVGPLLAKLADSGQAPGVVATISCAFAIAPFMPFSRGVSSKRAP